MLLLASADALGATCALVLGIFLALALAVAITRSRRRAGMAAVQRRFGGLAVPEGEGDEATTATLRFEADGRPARLTCYLGGEDSHARTELEVTQSTAASLSVVPRGLFDGSVDRDQNTGDEGFDRRFRVSCDTPARARELLGAEARHDLMALHDLGAGIASKGVRLHVGRASSAVVLPRDLLSDARALIQFVERALALLARIRAAS